MFNLYDMFALFLGGNPIQQQSDRLYIASYFPDLGAFSYLQNGRNIQIEQIGSLPQYEDWVRHMGYVDHNTVYHFTTDLDSLFYRNLIYCYGNHLSSWAEVKDYLIHRYPDDNYGRQLAQYIEDIAKALKKPVDELTLRDVFTFYTS